MSDNEPIKQTDIPDDSVSPDWYVSIPKDRLRSIRGNYKAMLHFCSRITGWREDEITTLALYKYDIEKYHKDNQFRENLSWPVETYLRRIKELENKVAELEQHQESDDG